VLNVDIILTDVMKERNAMFKKWYHYWDKETGVYCGTTGNPIGDGDRFIHQEVTPPEMPQKELADGWYLVQRKGTSECYFRKKEEGWLYDSNNWTHGPWRSDNYLILKNVTMEDLDE